MFITFEGPDGSGKSTQIALLAENLKQQGYSVVTTREPGGTQVGEQIREVLHNLENASMNARAELLLFSAARAQIVAEVIQPALNEGKVVLCDRFYDSTFAYQGYGHNLPLDTLRTITMFATGGLEPDLTLYLTIDPEVGLKRRQADEKAEWTRMDDYAIEFHKRVYEGYKKLIDDEPQRWRIIDANGTVQQVQNMILQEVESLKLRNAK